MSIEELFNFIREELKNCPGSAFIDKALGELRNAIAKREFFKPEKFKEWFIERNVIYKNNPLAFLTKCGIADIESGAFDKENVTGFAVHNLVEEFKKRNIAHDSQSDTLLRLEIYFVYIYNHDLMTMDEIYEWVHNAVDYISTHSKNSADFKELLLKSKSMRKLHLPYEDLEKEVAKKNKEWEDLIAKLGTTKKNDKRKEKDDGLPFVVDGNPLESETKNEKEENKINY